MDEFELELCRPRLHFDFLLSSAFHLEILFFMLRFDFQFYILFTAIG